MFFHTYRRNTNSNTCPPAQCVAVNSAAGAGRREAALPPRAPRAGSGRACAPRALTWSSGMPRSWLSGCRQVEPVVRRERLAGGAAAIPHLREAAAPAPARSTLLQVLPPERPWGAVQKGARPPSSRGPSGEAEGRGLTPASPAQTSRRCGGGGAVGGPCRARRFPLPPLAAHWWPPGPPGGREGGRQGGRKSGDWEPAPPGPDSGRREWKSDASG